MKRNLLVVHGGGPTAVMNASLCGVIRCAGQHACIDRIYGAKGGMRGLLEEAFVDLTELSEATMDSLMRTPGSAIGTSRYPVSEDAYKGIPAILHRHNIGYVLLNGGNGTMDTASRIYEACHNEDIAVLGIPKTVDNDIAWTDHSPGYGSAARFMMQSTAEIIADVRALPIHVAVIEAMGRNAGWITAASALAEDAGLGGPDLIYLPEFDFCAQAFLRDVKDILSRKAGMVVVCSEGLHDAEGNPVVAPVYRSDRATYFGNVSAYLADLVSGHLGYKAYSIKPGLLGRAASLCVSTTDRCEAFDVGRFATEAAVSGESGKMVGLVRNPDGDYSVQFQLYDLQSVRLFERKMPEEYVNAEHNGITEAFKNWCRPLVGEPLPGFCSFQ